MANYSKKSQAQIDYSDIMNLEFEEEIVPDEVYFKKNGFKYAIITKYVTKLIYFNWDKETKLCQMVRLDNKKEGNIMATMPIQNLNHLEELINFFCDNRSSFDYSHLA